MIKGHIAILILLCFCCTPDIKNEYKFESSETILHFDKGNTKIQMIISSYSANEPELKDTSLIVQRYQDSLQIEEINYSLKNGDSVEWSHIERTYNEQGLLLTEIVTNAGQQMLQLYNIYENGRLIISETNSFISKEMESPEYDTIKSRDMECKFWINVDEIDIEEEFAFNLTPAARREIRKLIFQNFDLIVESWKSYFK